MTENTDATPPGATPEGAHDQPQPPHHSTSTSTSTSSGTQERDRSAAGAAPAPGTGETGLPDWEKRFRAPRVSLPEWAEDAPDRSLYVSNATGTFELYAWDRATGRQRQVTDRPNGTTDGTLTPDGESIWWFSDTDGDEFGVWMRQPFHGGADEPAVPGLAPSFPAGLALGRDGTAVVGRSTDEDGTTIHLARPGAQPEEVYRHRESAGVGDMSYDGKLLVIEHTEHGDAMHSALRVVERDGKTVAELDDSKAGTRELGLSVLGFAPVPADPRLLVAHQRRGRWEPMIWEPVSGRTTDLAIDLPGDVSAEWYPDAEALLVSHSYQARSELWRYDIAARTLTRIETPAGTVSGATARPAQSTPSATSAADTTSAAGTASTSATGVADAAGAAGAADAAGREDDGRGHTVEYLWSSAAQPPRVRSTTGAVVLDPPGMKPPPSVPVEDAWVESPGGTVHALVQRPEGEGPFPTIFEVHGGPTWHDSDAFAAQPAAWVDHGFAVVRVNYRGSTGYGRAWTDALKHRVGLIELEDVAAVREWAVSSGVADPERLVLAGGSWGGYLTLLGIGTQPEAWAVGLAAVPVADYVTAYHDEMEALKSLDRTLLGGSPEEVPERFAASSPITYVDQVRAPVFISAGVNDPRCPIRQVENYVERLHDRGAPHEVYRYDAGHGSLVVEERIKQLKLEIDFALRHLPAKRPQSR